MPPVPSRKSSAPFSAGGTGRRAAAWQTSRLGTNTLLYGNLDQIRSRSRDAVRNNPWATKAIDSYVANAIGTGIKPQSAAPDPYRQKINEAWLRSTDELDAYGRTDLYGLQALWARETAEGGEVLVQYLDRRASDGLFVPLQLKTIQGEQLPIYQIEYASVPGGNTVRSGIEFDGDDRRIAYHLYTEHPGETMFFPGAFITKRVPANQIEHGYQVLSAGQLRGQPKLTPVLARLYELEQYDDAELVRKKIAAMFALFVKMINQDGEVLPSDPNQPAASDLGTSIAKIETGTIQQLLPGEDIVAPQIPQAGDYAAFMRAQLHAVAAGFGITYEQLTGDLSQVNYSSIRSGLLEFRRACEQYQYGTMIFQLCRPVWRRWMRTAVLSGALDLPGYDKDPYVYEKVRWIPPRWDWVDPLKDVQAKQFEIRAGLTSRATAVGERGEDIVHIDNEQAADNARADALGLVYDSDARRVLAKGDKPATAPVEKPTAPVEDASQEEDSVPQ